MPEEKSTMGERMQPVEPQEVYSTKEEADKAVESHQESVDSAWWNKPHT